MENGLRFQDKVVLVTGGGSGIGRAGALRFAQEGAKVVIADQNLEGAQKVVAEIQGTGREAFAVQVDVTQAAACEQMVKQTVDHFGRLDVVFADAGISGGTEVINMEPADWDRVIATNL